MTRCPSDLTLERHLLEPATSGVDEHIASCPTCGERLARMRREGDEFRALVYPATVAAVMDASVPVWRRWQAWALVPAFVAAGLVLVMLPERSADPQYHGTKGGGLSLTVFLGTGQSSRAVADGEAVRADAALRFQVRVDEPCHLWLVSVDDAATVSLLYPSGGAAAARVGGTTLLPGGALLDGREGPERIHAVCTREPLAYAELEQAVRASAGRGGAAVRAAGRLAALPAEAQQASVLLEKQ